jgi:hypothetical protein
MGVFIYADIPKELVENLLNEINFPALPQSQIPALLAEFETFTEKLLKDGYIKRRTDSTVPAGTFSVYPSIPQEAADVLNKFQMLKKLNAVEKIEMTRRALKYLRERGIPLRP